MKMHPTLLVASILALGATARAGVLVVADDGSGNFTDLPAAVTAAVDGDIILVRAGRYTGFTLANKSLDIVADQGAAAIVRSQVHVTQLGSVRSVSLTGLILRGPVNSPPNASAALRLTNNLGSVRVQGCEISGRSGPQCQTDAYGAAGVEIVSSSDVAFARCGITGGPAGDFGPVGHGGYGGDAVGGWNSKVAIYDCTLVAGRGASSNDECGSPPHMGFGGAGGNALSLLWSPSSFVSRTFLFGGDGGASGVAGCPGAGIFLFGNSGTSAIECQPAHGAPAAGGSNPCTPQDVLVSPGTSFSSLPGFGRVLTANRIVHEQATLRLECTGQPGDAVEVAFAERGRFQLSSAWRGVSLLAANGHSPLLQAGTIGTSGTLSIAWPIPDLGPNVRGRRVYFQAIFREPNGTTTYSAPATVVMLDSTL